jgi:hypothetical protein
MQSQPESHLNLKQSNHIQIQIYPAQLAFSTREWFISISFI